MTLEYIINIGRLTNQKNHELLIKAFSEFRKSDKNLNLVSALNALNSDLTNFQAGISRDLEHTNRIIDSNFTRLKRIDKKVDVNKRDIMNSLPTQIRKTIGHIEFAHPLDKK